MKRGFTLIELIIVVIIIGILAGVAVPQYLKAVERAKGGKARHALGLIGQAEKMFRADSATGVYSACANKVACNANLETWIELAGVAADVDWDYAVTVSAAPPAFTATATRVAGSPNAAETITMTQDGVWDGTFIP